MTISRVWEDLGRGVWRLPAPGGWVLQPEGGGSLLFIADAEGAWVQPAQAPVVPAPPPIPVPVPPPPPPAPTPTPPVVPTPPLPPASRAWGVNLAPLTDFSPQVAFSDMFAQSRDWISHGPNSTWDTGLPVALRSDGWPARLASGQQLGSLMAWGTGAGAWPEGKYVVTYAGKGAIALKPENGNASTVISSAPGRLEFNYMPFAGGLNLIITATDPADPVRDVRVVKDAPGTIVTPKWDARFTSFCSRFACLRFMDWQQTNNSAQRTWSTRALATGKQTMDPGVAYEHMIDLCNATGADAWFCIPHLADDDYVAQAAALVKQRLNGASRAYFEYSNECWNTMFQQSQYCAEQGRALNLDANAFSAQLKFYRQRALQVLAICRRVFGSDTRLVRVLAGHVEHTSGGDTITAGSHGLADAYAVAPYFGGGLDAGDGLKTVDAVVAACNADIARLPALLATNKTIAAKNGLQFIAYEGGQHLRDNADGDGGRPNSVTTDLFIATNADPKFQAVYARYLATCRQVFNGVFCHYWSIGKDSKFGSWSLAPNMIDMERPKMRALMAAT